MIQVDGGHNASRMKYNTLSTGTSDSSQHRAIIMVTGGFPQAICRAEPEQDHDTDRTKHEYDQGPRPESQ